MSSFCAPRRSALAELAGLALAAAAVAALAALQALRATHPRLGEVRASLLSEDSAQVAEIVGDFLVLVHFLHAVLFLTALRGLFLCCFLLKRRTSAAAVLDVQKLALALSSPSPGTAEEEDERPDGSPATLSMSSVAPDLVAMEMADGLQIFRKSSPQLVCQVRLLRPRKIYRHICMIVATSFTDLLVAMQFLEPQGGGAPECAPGILHRRDGGNAQQRAGHRRFARPGAEDLRSALGRGLQLGLWGLPLSDSDRFSWPGAPAAQQGPAGRIRLGF
ncbi:unnamed protein product [Effrenium voratum]|nr:unnamed protein product [Effrenium voratum]